MDAIDLTLSDSDDDVRLVKRQRLGSSDDEVQVVEKPSTPAPAAAGPEPTLGDEDFLITGAVGPVWNQDLPHSRTQCGKHPFTSSKTPSNREHCSKCFCYVCDVEAGKCQHWGSGHSSQDHCNAHGGRQLYRDMRSAARQSAASASSPALPSGAAGPSRSAATPSGRQPSLPTSAARQSGGSAAAASKPSVGSVPAARPPAPSSAAQGNMAGGSATGTHCRVACGICRFSMQPSTTNRPHCNLCKCYICDVLAANCKHWGSGASRSDHCNAHAGMQVYRVQREALQNNPQLRASTSQAAMPALPQPPPYPVSEDGSDSEVDTDYGNIYGRDDSEGDEDRYEMFGALYPPNFHPMAEAQNRPRTKAPMHSVEVGRLLADPARDANMLELGTVHLPIRAKAPYTVADLQQRLVPTGIASRFQGDDIFADSTRVAISNILYSEMLEVLPLPLPEHGCEPTPMRVRRVTIVNQDGRAKPLTIGVSVHKEAKVSELLEAVKQHPAAACGPQEELVIGACNGDRIPFARTFIVRDTSTKTSESHAKQGYVVFRVPRTKMVESKPPTRVMVLGKRPNLDGGYPEYLDTAHTLLLNLPGALWMGGKEEDKKVAAMVAAALAPYRKAGAPNKPLNQCFTLQRCGTSGYQIYGSKRNFIHAVQHIREASACIHNGVLYLAAMWKPAGLALYDTESWSQPEVHNSASPNIMAETERLIQEEERLNRMKRERAQLPKDMIREIGSTCRTFKADQLKLAQRYGPPAMALPAAACKLAIVPEQGGNDEHATLEIKVFVWKSRSMLNREFFQSPDDWLLPLGKEKRNSPESTEVLPLVMQHLLRDDPVAKAMRDELDACAVKMRKDQPFSATGLMKFLEAGERPEAPQPPGLTVTLHPYQRQSLRFMLDNERGDGGHRRHFWVPYKTPSGFTFWWSPVFQRACRDVAPCPWGGFLAEEMGCGKTVEILALILSNPAPPNVVSGTLAPDGSIQSTATLVVCAVSLVGQWMEEARSKLNGSLRMYQYHGQGRNRDPQKLATEYDLVVTTYQTLGSDWRMYTKKGGNTDGNFKPLGQIKWHRVVLDESHTVKAGGAQQAMACCALKADRRWCCSGTPISTDVSEFMGQFKFLGCHPFGTKNYFQYHVRPTWTPGCYQRTGGSVSLLFALGRTAIRHTQQQRLGGETVCKLPEKTEETIAVEFSEEEERLYLRVHKDAKAEFQKYTMQGAHHVARNLLAIMSLLSPLRAICSGGILREKDVKVPSSEEEQEVPAGVDPNLVAPREECSICLNLDMERPCRTPCLHWFCRECITAELAVRDKCPLCRKDIQMAQLTEGVSAPQDNNGDGDAVTSNGAAANITVSESKLRVLLDELAKMRASDPSAKALIFTQFNSTLEWLMSRLTQEGYSYRTISGSMPLKKRSQAIEAFQRDPPTTVFLLSMRSGAVGINLTAANHVFILEPAMNPALEDQAVGRAVRMGQTRPVTVKKLYIKGSVEERIMELVKDRREGRATAGAAGSALAQLDEGDYEARMRKGKMKQQDVAGSINRDRQNLRMAELQLLFRDPTFANAPGFDRTAAAYDAAPAPAACGGRM